MGDTKDAKKLVRKLGRQYALRTEELKIIDAIIASRGKST